LFRNGGRWWVRVRDPISRTTKKRSTGTTETSVANAIVTMLTELRQDRTHGWPWLTRIVAGEVPLLDVYNARVRGALHTLAVPSSAPTSNASPTDLREWVDRWISDALPHRVSRKSRRALSERQRGDYARQVRVLVPAGSPLHCSALSEDYVTATLARLDAKPQTARNYVNAWRLFVRWARRKGAPIPTDPFEYCTDWLPGASRPRSTVWSHTQRLAVLAELRGPAKAAAALMLGSGMELAAILRLRGRDVSRDRSRTVFADGTKTDSRSRHVTVDAWAWPIVEAHARSIVGTAHVFPWSETTKGVALRESFYRAQVRAGLCELPATSEHGYLLWNAVNPHTLHDCRHTYAVCRGLGLDGEPAQDNVFLASQLGHADETMVTRIYKRLAPARRQQLLAEAATLRQASRSA